MSVFDEVRRRLDRDSQTRTKLVKFAHTAPDKVYLRFGDGLRGEWTVQKLALSSTPIRHEKLVLNERHGEQYIELIDKNGEVVGYLGDGGSCRYEIDPSYAAEIDASNEAMSKELSKRLERIPCNQVVETPAVAKFIDN